MTYRTDYYADEPQGSQAFGACRPVGSDPCGRRHMGDDYSHSTVPDTVEVPYVRGGVVVAIQYDKPGLPNGYGNQVTVEHSDGTRASYSHLGRITASIGQAVDIDDSPGTEGVSGFVTGSCLHLEYRTTRGVLVDPRPFVVTAIATPSSGGGSSPLPTTKEIRVRTYHVEDAKAQTPNGRPLAPNRIAYLHTDPKAADSKATNVAGRPGPYSFTPHIYAEGIAGDIVNLVLLWDDTKTGGPHSPHYTEQLVIGPNGKIRASREFKRAVASGEAVYVQVSTPPGNKGPVKITRLDIDAFLFTAA